MNSEVTLYRPSEVALESLSTDELREMLASSLRVTADHLMHLAAIWKELERRGEDLSALRTGIATYLPLITSGDLDARLVVRYAGKNMLLRQVAALPMDTQAELVDDDHVMVVNAVEGDIVEEKVSLSALDVRAIRNVLTDHILTTEEQRANLLKRGSRKRASGVVAEAQKRGRRGVRGEGYMSIQVPLSSAEREKLHSFADENEVSIAALARAAILKAIS